MLSFVTPWVIKGLLIWGLVAPLGTWGFMSFTNYWDKINLKAEVTTQERIKCDERVRDVIKNVKETADNEVDRKVQEALATRESFKLPPDIAKLCRRSASCRERNTLK